MPSSPDDLRKIVTAIHPSSVGRAARIPQQQRPGLSVGDGLLFGPLIGDSTLPLQPDVAVRINKAGHDPRPRGNGLGVGYRLGTDHTVHHPEIPVLPLRQHHANEVEAIMPVDRLRAHWLFAEAAA